MDLMEMLSRGLEVLIVVYFILVSAVTLIGLLLYALVVYLKKRTLEDFFKLDYPGAHKIMVGDGPMLEEYKELYPDVEFVGAKRGKELGDYYRMADVFVFPSRWETFGLVMIEAMACGTPVAAYPCQGPLDVVDEGITGCMNDNLKQAVNDALMLDSTASLGR
jgi:glycosyltransferase involved in cell wall biosynthesis